MTNGTKEQLSQHMESIFKEYVAPGLHVCDLATGGGKSYTISKLTCEYYPGHFDRIIILCVQTKLVNDIREEINKFISARKGDIGQKDVLVVSLPLIMPEKSAKKPSKPLSWLIPIARRRGLSTLKGNCMSMPTLS